MERMTKHAWKPDVKDGRYGYGRMKEDVTCTFAGCKYKTRAKSTMIIHMATHDEKKESHKDEVKSDAKKYTPSSNSKEDHVDKEINGKPSEKNNNSVSDPTITPSIKEEMLKEQRESGLLEEAEPHRDFRQPMPNNHWRFSYDTLQCVVCDEKFDGKGAKMQRIQHMIYHFREKLKKDIDMRDGPPYKCPVAGCTFTAKFDYNWCIHYGRVHGMIRKYEQEYIEENLVKGDTEEDRERSREDITKKYHVENIVRRRPWQQAMVTADPKKSANNLIRQRNPNEVSFGMLANNFDSKKSSTPWVPNLSSHMPSVPGYNANERVFGNVGTSRYQSTPAQSRMASQSMNMPTFGDLASGSTFGDLAKVNKPDTESDLSDSVAKIQSLKDSIFKSTKSEFYDTFNSPRQPCEQKDSDTFGNSASISQPSFFQANPQNSYFSNYNGSRIPESVQSKNNFSLDQSFDDFNNY